MTSTYTANNGIEKIETGDQSGTWGETTNTNFDIIDRALNGVGSITLSGTSHTLTTTDGSLTDGMFKVLSLAGSPTGTNTITISPNDQDKLYFVKNASGQSAVFSQGTGANVTIPNGGADIIFADGAGSGAAVSSLFASSVIFGDNVTLNSDSAVLGFGADTDTTLTHTDGTGLTLNSTNKLTFGDAASFIQQSSNGVLRIDGEATIDLNASTAVTVSNDLKLDSDSAVLGFGADNDVTITHDPDDGLFFKSAATGDDNPFVLTIQTGETDIAQDDKLGVINFQAPDEGAGTDAILVAAGIEAIAEGDFAADSNATSLVFKTGASAAAAEQARIDSAGRVQINATDGSEFLNVNGALGVKGASSNFSAGPARTLVDYTGSLGRVGTVNGTGTATPLTFLTNNGEAMRIDTSKRVLINTTTSVSGYQLQVTNSSGSVQQLLTAAANFNSTIAFADPDSNTAGQVLYAHNGDQLRFHVAGASTANVLIDSNGTLIINDTARTLACRQHVAFAGNGEQGIVVENTENNQSGAAVRFVDSDGDFSGGGIFFQDSNSITYATSSDYRLKENAVSLTNATDRLKQIPVYRFNFKKTPDKTVDGFMAHEVQAIVPESVIGTKDEVDEDGKAIYQKIDQSKLVPLLVATIKELEARITALES